MEKKVEKLKQEIRTAEKEIENLQNSCKHEKEKIKMTENHDIRWVCEDCDKVTRFPTPEQIIQFLS